MKKNLLNTLKYLLGTVALIAVIVFLLAIYPLNDPLQQKSAVDGFVIRNVNIVDVANNTLLKGKTLVIENRRINEIRDGELTDPESMQIIDAKGAFALAGLWDMHSHLGFHVAPQIVMPLHIANGVTNIRDMQGVMNINGHRRKWSAQIENGALLGPRIVGYAANIVGDNYDDRDVLNVVDRLASDPRTFVKIYSGILDQRYFDLARAANSKGVDFAGHYPLAIDPVEASNAGQRSFEHAHLFIQYSNTNAQEFRDYYRSVYSEQEADSSKLPARADVLKQLDYEKFEQLVDVMIENDTYFCPTHVTKNYEASVFDSVYLETDKLKYIPPIVSFMWKDDVAGMLRYDKQELSDFHQKGLEMTGLAHKRGLKILTGTDSYDPYSFPGFGVHDELAQLVKAGLTPAQALKTATINPAEYFNVSADHGTIAEGKFADFLLLDKNPLDDIQNTQTIQTVVFNGAVYQKSDLNDFLVYVQENASGLRGLSISVKMFFGMVSDNNPEARNRDE